MRVTLLVSMLLHACCHALLNLNHPATAIRPIGGISCRSLLSRLWEKTESVDGRRAYLDERTLWRITLRLTRAPHPEQEAVLRVRFIEDRGFEPPSGRLFIEDDYNGLVRVTEDGYSTFKWTLSEDKNDRKDGLWVWGLFKEPRYPFLYLSIGVFDDIILTSGESEPLFGGAGVPGDRLFLRFNHARTSERGVVLSEGELQFKRADMVSADPLGVGGLVDVGEMECAGSITIQPVFG